MTDRGARDGGPGQRAVPGAGLGKPQNQDTRSRMIAAVLDCIVERGYYRATSNEIASRAGLTWGAIQRNFGTRERLMLAALEAVWLRLIDTLRSVHFEGATIEERLGELFGPLASHYREPTYLAGLQIAMDLRTNPDTSADVIETIGQLTATVEGFSPALLRDLMWGHEPDPALRTFVYFAIRDWAIGLHLMNFTTSDATVQHRLAGLQREQGMLIRALATAIEQSLAAGPR